MEIDYLKYDQILLDYGREKFGDQELDGLKQHFGGEKNYIKADQKNTRIECFWHWMWLSTIEKTKVGYIITCIDRVGDFGTPETKYHILLQRFSKVIAYIQGLIKKRGDRVYKFSQLPTKNLIIQEKLGVSYEIKPAVDLILDKLWPFVLSFLESEHSSETIRIKILWDEFEGVWIDNPTLFYEFPLEKAYINLTLSKTHKTNFRGKYAVGGAAYKMAEEGSEESSLKTPNRSIKKSLLDDLEKTISAKMDFSVKTGYEIPQEVREALFVEFKATIMHELSHLAQFYKEGQNRQPEQSFALSWAGSKNYNIPKPIWKIWYGFHFLVYLSQKTEQNALVQEASVLIESMHLQEFKKTNIWTNIQKLKNFQAQEMLENLENSIQELLPRQRDSILERLLRWFQKDYMELEKTRTDTPLYSQITGATNLESLVKGFQKRINWAGNDLEKKVLRLYSLR
jgi:hypothetical protein